jgi:Zn-dependent metalloprotease
MAVFIFGWRRRFTCFVIRLNGGSNQMKRNRSIVVAGVLATLLIAMVFVFTSSVNARPSESATALQQENGIVPDVPGTFLTGPNEGEPLAIAMNFVQANRGALGLSEAEVSNLVVNDMYYSQKSAITHIYLMQTHNGIEVYNTIINVNIAADGSVINLGNHSVANLTAVIQDNGVQLSAVDAVVEAAQHLRLELEDAPVIQEVIGGAAQAVILSPSGISQNAIPARLVFQPMADGAVKLAWDLTIYELSGENWWSIRLDAANGQVLNKDNYVDHDNWGYSVHNGQGSAIQEESLNVPLAFSTVPLVISFMPCRLKVRTMLFQLPRPMRVRLWLNPGSMPRRLLH